MTITRGTFLTISAVCYDRPKMAHELLLFYQYAESIQDALDTYFTHQKTSESARNTLRSRLEQFNEVQIEATLKTHSIAITCFGDNDYPEQLSKVAYPPLVLYYKGQLKCLNKPCLGVVGPRKMSVYGKKVAQYFTKHLCQGFCIVSGLASGVDTMAHQVSLNENKYTVAVLGNGLDRCYPSENVGLFYQIEQNGCLLSEFPPGVGSKPHHFPQRNRIVSGLSLGILVVEGSVKSGSMITAKLALEDNKDVFAVPGDIFTETSKGVNSLLKDGAQFTTHPNDIFTTYSSLFSSLPKQPKTVTVELNKSEKKVLKSLHFTPQNLDNLRIQTQLDTPLLLATLSALELHGLIESDSGLGYALKP